MSSESSTEIFFLKIFKIVILAFMSLALIITIGSLFYAAYEYSQKPKEPAPAKTAPVETVNIDEFIKGIQESKKSEEAPKDEDKDTTTETPKQEKSLTKKYQNEAKELLACLKSFDTNVKRPSNIDEDGIRQWLQRNADNSSKDRGQPWATESVKYNCAVISTQQVIEYAAKKQDASIINLSARFHIEKWDEIKDRIAQFNHEEQLRIKSERDAEEQRVFLAKANALSLLIIAASVFGIFMLLALYLIISAIESNLRNINQSIKSSKLDNFNKENLVE